MSLPAALVTGDGRFDIEAARFLARLSRAAYRSPAEFSEAIRRVARRVQSVEYIASPLGFLGYDTQAYLVNFGPAAVLVFRGTERNHWDILTDLKIRKRELTGIKSGGRVHRGFQAAHKSVWPEIVEQLRALPGPVYVAGHSLGGALAILSAQRYRFAAAYTFGAPRVGDKEFARYAGPPGHYRIDNGIDIVPKLPLLVMGYKHSGHWCYIASGGGLWIDPKPAAAIADMVVTAARGLLKRSGWRRYAPVGMLAAHRISAYEVRLNGVR